jgi:hypothetical protein
VAFYLFFWVILVLPSAGVVIAAGATSRPKPIGWLLIVIGVSGAVALVGRWARILPGVFGPAVLNGLIILSDGHALNQPNAPVPRWEALVMIALMLLGAITTAPFLDGNVRLEDKIGALGIWVCFVAGFVGIVLPLNGWEAPVGIALVACLVWIQIKRMRRRAAARHQA